ncbi:MAG: right-handed parallel beta-helix repeat-containing protein, partial [Candidatus Cloacimonetes bacterium]|nr:right-handed parallel beta-helix repeat-containing protein [Candidatus Cloacimonadota bacterium]
MLNLNNSNDHLIPILWESGGPNPSSGYSTRGSLYGVGGVPHAQFGGTMSVIGGSPSSPMNYQPQYNSIINTDSPLSMELSMTISGQNELILATDIEVTSNIATTNNKVIFIVTYNYGQIWFSNAVSYNPSTVFDLTTVGQTGNYEFSFPMNPDWDLVNLKGIALVQSFGNNYQILQGVSSMFTGILPMFSSNVTEGPAYLGVQFNSNSFPQTGINSWEWDFDGDGIFDSTQENPYHLYTEPGEYDVTLRIEVDGEFAETTVENYITVTDGSSVSGILSGIWVPSFNPYVISDDITIPDGYELMITPGVELQFADDVQFTVNGLLEADASALSDDPIVFKSDSSWQGIRFFLSQENNILANCEISNASVTAIKVEGDSKVDVIGCRIFENSSTSLGAAFEIIGSDNVLISKNIIANNTSTNAVGGIKCTDSSIEITNNLIVNNSGSYGAIILMNSSDIEFTNNTIANNEANGVNAYTFFILSSNPIIKNCIIIDNNSIFFSGGTVDVTYTCISGGYEGIGNIDEDPLFVAPTTGDGIEYNGLAADWSLQPASLCIDAGDPDVM